ncbi:MAG: Glu/Leu/Phe/Val dehydrogenase [Acidobacteria bacterium]|nr:Glu/Leu/Phe/Val dehydrogenase [Acidobacteriota bacterium]
MAAPSTTIVHGSPPAPVSWRVDRDGELLGFVAIDSTVEGRARGGLRLVADLSEPEMRDAARAMTLKYGLLGLPQGGAKAGVVGDPDAPPDQRRRRLETFARAVEPLLRERRYIPDADLGTDATAIRTMMQAVGIPMRARDWRAGRSGDHTARSCLAAGDVLVARRGLCWPACRVAIEGFGKVGGAAARMVAERGGRVVAVSTSHGALVDADGLDVDDLTARAAAAGSRFVLDTPGVLPRDALFDAPADVLLPCARRHGIDVATLDRVSARVICPGANNPLTDDAEAALDARGILSVPDFVSNCGGVLGGTLEFAGVPANRIGPIIDMPVRRWVGRFLDEAGRQGTTVRAVAEAESLARHARVAEAAAHPTLMGRVRGLGLEAYRREWIPESLMGALAPWLIARAWR